MLSRFSLVALCLIFFYACDKSAPAIKTAIQTDTAKLSPIDQRIAEARERLNQTEAGQLVWLSIQHHGGLEKWWSQGPLFFRFNYQPKPGTGTARDTYETADYWTSRTRHQRRGATKQEFGWDGEKAWYFPADATIPYDVRFWSLTPYYFVGMPFVFADPGVSLQKEADIIWEEKTYHSVRVTFGENIGDAPDDYYVLYLEPDTGRLAAIRYIVSYAGYFPDGGHSQEKLMSFDGEQLVGSIKFPISFRTYMWTAAGPDEEQVTFTEVSDLTFKPETPVDYFNIPPESVVLEGL